MKMSYKSAIKKLYNAFLIKTKWSKLPNGIYVFNYHRIGDSSHTAYDPNIFSCTENEFKEHISFYKNEFQVISTDDLVDMFEEGQSVDKKYAVLTFDDGYIDNYEVAYPVLKKFNLPATFFLTTDYLDNPQIPWWDEVAWLLKKSKINRININNKVITIDKNNIEISIRSVLKEIKSEKQIPMAEKIGDIRKQCQMELTEDARTKNLFINWEQVKEMSDGGMFIGSHGVSHNILSHLDEKSQLSEISNSKSRLENMLGKTIETIAYPVGGPTAYYDITKKIVSDAGFKIGFSFVNGIVSELNEEIRFDFNRIGIDVESDIITLKAKIIRTALDS